MSIPWPILIFFAAHWWLSVFFQSFFLHRYGAHRVFRTSKGWERFFQICTYVTQGSSYLNPRAYAILHRMHHVYSDTEKDPHSPVIIPNPLRMMTRTWAMYHDILHEGKEVEPRFSKDTLEWPWLDSFAHSWVSNLAWSLGYILFYVSFATAPWQYLLLPFHFMMGPIHGLIVNYFGHKLGYRSFNTKDDSRNTLFIDFVTCGELFQNNHHARASSAKFAARWYEVDPVWPVLWLLDKVNIIELETRARPRDIAAPSLEEAAES